MVDVKGCTDADVLLAITRDAVRRPVAEGMMTLLIGITHYLPIKDGLVRSGRWARRVEPTDEWAELLLEWPEQVEYEGIRPALVSSASEGAVTSPAGFRP
jgi:lactate dehydrogenase-like 2-hydroxyacid dehydrogenase